MLEELSWLPSLIVEAFDVSSTREVKSQQRAIWILTRRHVAGCSTAKFEDENTRIDNARSFINQEPDYGFCGHSSTRSWWLPSYSISGPTYLSTVHSLMTSYSATSLCYRHTKDCDQRGLSLHRGNITMPIELTGFRSGKVLAAASQSRRRGQYFFVVAMAHVPWSCAAVVFPD